MQKMMILTGAVTACVAVYFAIRPSETTTVPADQSNAIVFVKLPEALSSEASIGESVYQAKCAVCHGDNAAGQDGVAPPLVHKIYEPSHHGDEAFQRAVETGVRGHHWPFGNMPPVAGLTRADVTMIIIYIRELQRFNGID